MIFNAVHVTEMIKIDLFVPTEQTISKCGSLYSRDSQFEPRPKHRSS